MSENKDKVEMDGSGLEDLLQKAIDAATADVKEAQTHVDAIEKLIKEGTTTNALQRYSIMYQEALKVKGIARDRHIKLVRMIQDRVRVKEVAKQTKGGIPWMVTPDQIQDFLDKEKDKDDE